MNELRRLDFDDLWLLQALLEGKTLTAIASEMNISQPAISQRLRKIEDVFAAKLLQQQGRRLALTEDGVSLATKATSALKLMQALPSQQKKAVINVGTRPEVGLSWLSGAIFDLRKEQEDLCFHIHMASGSEILQRLGTGSLDAVLTSAPVTLRDFRSIELAKEEYIFVAHKNLRPKIKTTDDLQNHILIEFDRSFPFLRYLEPETRSVVTFGDVWFLGSTELMARAIGHAHGVGIVPRYLVHDQIEAGELEVLSLSKKLSHDYFRFIIRNDPVLESHMTLLAKRMRQIGLQ